MNKNIIYFTLASFITFTISSCKVDTDTKLELGDDTAQQVASDTEDAILEQVASEIVSRLYRVEGFSKLNLQRYPSEGIAEHSVDVYVDNENLWLTALSYRNKAAASWMSNRARRLFVKYAPRTTA